MARHLPDIYSLYFRAECRVDGSPRLRPYKHIILAYWTEGDDHLRWVVRGRVREIEAWAKEISDGEETQG